MKTLKKILIGLAILIAIPFIAALFIPKKYTASATTTINAPLDSVMNYIKLFSNQPAYSEWLKPDPSCIPTITGSDGNIGAQQYWNSKDDNVGEGTQTITNISADRIDVAIEFIRPFKSVAKASNILKPISPTQTSITSEFYTEEGYPMNFMSYLIGKPMIEKTEAKILSNLKEILEK